jgi:uncharacterized protein (TIGR00288 family)
MQNDEKRIAVFIDFENVAMGVRESKYGNFNIDLVLKRLVEKGKIMVKRAYSDWHRYAEFKRAFHQAAIELIDVPQTRYSGKNSADIRMVVDALDLSYQKEHIDTFVLVSGDSDFSPLVSKLRENGRYVIGMGVKQSSSDLLINNCDEFIFYEDLVRPASVVTVVDPQVHHLSPKKAEAIRLVLETFEALQREGKEVIYGSMIKQTLIRKLPSFNETYYGYPMFSRLLEDAAENKLLKLAKDQKSGGYIVTPPTDAAAAPAESSVATGSTTEIGVNGSAVGQVTASAPAEPRDRFRRGGRWDRSRSRRGDRYGDASQSTTATANISESLPVESSATPSRSELVESSQRTEDMATGAEAIHPTPPEPSMARDVGPSVADEPHFVDSGLPVPEAAPSGDEATVAPAPRNQQRARGARRPPRFRQAAAAGSANRAQAAPMSLEPVPVQPQLAEISGETALASPLGNDPPLAAEGKATAATGKTSSGRTGRHSRPARSNRSSGNKKKPT